MPIPRPVLDSYGFSPHGIEVVRGGLINATYQVRDADGLVVAALQRLHPVFGAEVNLDIEAITDILSARGVLSPRLLRTAEGRAWVEHEGDIWRSLTWIEGKCFSVLPRPAMARSAAKLVARFHRAVDGSLYTFRSVRAGVHDTAAHFAKLRKVEHQNFGEIEQADALRRAIEKQAQALPPLLCGRERICHGDLKLANLLFDSKEEGLCLVDLDTMGRQSIAYELGDALRSWANLRGEDQSRPAIDPGVVEEAAIGYAQGAGALLDESEVRAVIIGLETVCLELAARFCLDIYQDTYFGWDAEKYESRREHNLIRALGQLTLCQSVAAQRESLQELWTRPFQI